MRVWRFVLVAWLTGCATTPAGPPVVGAAPEADGRALAAVLAASRPVASDSALSAHRRAPVFGAAKGDIRDVYRKVAPATVLIRAGGGFGTGIVINAKGFILTNHHVVAHAETVDFKRRVTVERGHLGAGGVMELDPEPLTAWVLKSDPLLDLAVLKLDAPPKDLRAVKVSARDPVPGEPVSALGNGGIGLLWAIKDGEIASIGKLATHLAQLVAAQCQVSEGTSTAEACRAANASAELQKELIEKQVPGLVIQSSCTISPGDSGGPLVNRAGELVGVNAFLRSDPRAPVTSNFHVHVAEVRSFLKDVPAEPVALVPDPHQLLRFGRWLDTDGDGRRDLYVAGGPGAADVMVELGGIGGGLDPDLAVAVVEDQRLAWYDVDDDGRFDRVVIASFAGRGRESDEPAKAWSLGAGLTLGRFLGAAKLIDPDAFEGERRQGMAALVPSLLPLVGLSRPGDPAQPPADATPTSALVLGDGDGDGKQDFALATTVSGARVLLDPAQAVLPGLRVDEARERLAQGTLATRAVLVSDWGRTWGLVDAAGQRLALASKTGREVVEDAFVYSPTGRGEARPEWWGTIVDRAVAMHFDGEERERLAAALARASAQSKPRRFDGGFPSPLVELVDPLAEDSGVPGLEWAVVSLVGARGDASAMVFELEPDAIKGQSAAQREAAVKKGGAGTDFAWMSWGDWRWFFYDLDADGAFEVVLIRRGARLEARRVGRDGRLTVDAALAKGPAVRPSLFTGARAEALKKLAPIFFGPDEVERSP